MELRLCSRKASEHKEPPGSTLWYGGPSTCPHRPGLRRGPHLGTGQTPVQSLTGKRRGFLDRLLPNVQTVLEKET